MTNQLNHANRDEQERRNKLLQKYKAGIATSRELIELALLLWEPYHQEAEAVSILREVLPDDPNTNLAKLWLGYVYVYYSWLFGPASIDQAIDVLKEVIATGTDYWVAGARVVLYGALRELDRTNTRRQERISSLEESIRLEPEWVLNHHYLGFEFFESARYFEALEQIRKARKYWRSSNIRAADLVDQRFESLITGRLSRTVTERLDSLEAKIIQERPELGVKE